MASAPKEIYTFWGGYRDKKAVEWAADADLIVLKSTDTRLHAVHPIPAEFLKLLSHEERCDVRLHVEEILPTSNSIEFIEVARETLKRLDGVHHEEALKAALGVHNAASSRRDRRVSLSQENVSDRSVSEDAATINSGPPPSPPLRVPSVQIAESTSHQALPPPSYEEATTGDFAYAIALQAEYNAETASNNISTAGECGSTAPASSISDDEALSLQMARAMQADFDAEDRQRRNTDASPSTDHPDTNDDPSAPGIFNDANDDANGLRLQLQELEDRLDSDCDNNDWRSWAHQSIHSAQDAIRAVPVVNNVAGSMQFARSMTEDARHAVEEAIYEFRTAAGRIPPTYDQQHRGNAQEYPARQRRRTTYGPGYSGYGGNDHIPQAGYYPTSLMAYPGYPARRQHLLYPLVNRTHPALGGLRTMSPEQARYLSRTRRPNPFLHLRRR